MNFIKRYWSAFLAFLFTWISPLIIVLIQGVELLSKGIVKTWKFEIWAMVILAIILIFYFTKGKKKLEQKLFTQDVQGKARNPFLVLLNGILTIVVFAFLWLLFKTINLFGIKIETFSLVVLNCESVGALFNFIFALSEKKRELNVK